MEPINYALTKYLREQKAETDHILKMWKRPDCTICYEQVANKMTFGCGDLRHVVCYSCYIQWTGNCHMCRA